MESLELRVNFLERTILELVMQTLQIMSNVDDEIVLAESLETEMIKMLVVAIEKKFR